jgi:hypothetical protein
MASAVIFYFSERGISPCIMPVIACLTMHVVRIAAEFLASYKPFKVVG